MSKIPDWPSLWKREPALRPFNLQPPWGPRKNWCGDIGGEAHGSRRVIDAEMAAAMCRDAAVRWLADELTYVVIGFHHAPGGAEVWFMGRVENNPEKHSTLDAALFAACEAVLNARVKA